jgi:hypothetical protein
LSRIIPSIGDLILLFLDIFDFSRVQILIKIIFFSKRTCIGGKRAYLCVAFKEKWFGEVAQSVEQRTENPCVGGSIPSFTTKKSP